MRPLPTKEADSLAGYRASGKLSFKACLLLLKINSNGKLPKKGGVKESLGNGLSLLPPLKRSGAMESLDLLSCSGPLIKMTTYGWPGGALGMGSDALIVVLKATHFPQVIRWPQCVNSVFTLTASPRWPTVRLEQIFFVPASCTSMEAMPQEFSLQVSAMVAHLWASFKLLVVDLTEYVLLAGVVIIPLATGHVGALSPSQPFGSSSSPLPLFTACLT